MTRREELAEAATDYVLEHGIIGLSLRPLAAAIGTSDRMLLYHFEDKDDLIATVLQVSSDRSVQAVTTLPRPRRLRGAVLEIWSAYVSGPLDRCQRLYVQAAALGLLGREPYLSVVRQSNARWTQSLTDYFVRAGASRARAIRAVALLDATLMGLQLDLAVEADPNAQLRTVRDLADAVVAILA